VEDQLAARYPDKAGGHTGDCRDEEEQFRHRQYPIATHARLNCLDESNLPNEERQASMVNEKLTNGFSSELSPL
jgi:hypothetical protein